MKVKIPFREEFRDRMLLGQKTCTSRTRKLGNVDDSFEAFGAEFIIGDVWAGWELDMVSFYWHKEEGFNTPEAFIECWNKIHPRKGYDPDQRVFIHWFRKTKGVDVG